MVRFLFSLALLLSGYETEHLERVIPMTCLNFEEKTFFCIKPQNFGVEKM